MGELVDQIGSILRVLFDSEQLMRVMGQPEFTLAAFVALALIIFTETGLLVGFFLPGDSLLVTVGMVAYGTHAANPGGGWNVPLLMAILSAAAIIGDTVGYGIGLKGGPRLFKKEKSLFFAKDHLLAAQAFYERHGGKTIVLARFMPIVRTFAPVVAGIGRMHYGKFLMYNVVGGIAWVVSMIAVGYYLTSVINPLLQPILGEAFDVKRHLEKVIIVVVLLSISPGLYAAGKAWLAKRRAARSFGFQS